MMAFNQTGNPGPLNKTTIDVYVRNVGQIDVKMAAMYVNGTSRDFQPTMTGGYPIYVKAGNATCVMKFKITYSWVNGSAYVVRAVTTRGNWAISTAIAP